MTVYRPIGVFDSGYGGLTILKALTRQLPEYDFLYLGDNARAPYGNRSFETVYRYTLSCVRFLFASGCRLVILACNTASSRALRTIQQKDLPGIDPEGRVLGVIRPTAEIAGIYSKTGRIGIFATSGTVNSQSYPLEIAKCYPGLRVFQEACPMWVPLVENNEYDTPGADYFIKKHVDHLYSQSTDIDAIILGCTHYPLLASGIRKHLREETILVSQDEIIASSLVDYLHRHPEMDINCSKTANLLFLTTDDPDTFDHHAGIFFGVPVKSGHAVPGGPPFMP
ncbi:MAG TPA: glutamate racemase [Chitinophagaceae bacterium]|nr:glutamate racemase [Chitinophagaceae bacterium]